MNNIKKTVVLSTNDNESYYNYYNYTVKAWNTLGWDTLTFYLGERNLKENENNKVIKLNRIEKYKDEIVVQVSRLFGHKYCDGMLMTSDMDMIPLSNYWNPDIDEITCYGHDLNDYQQIPMCYIAMSHINWKKIIPEDGIEDLLNKYTCSLSSDWMTRWTTDQAIVTDRLNNIKHSKIDRGKVNGIAVGRIDKIKWEETFYNNDIKIDCHVPRCFNKNQVESVMRLIK